jgi:mannose-6-phosphate isomerase-like protein (cupin superfamily)
MSEQKIQEIKDGDNTIAIIYRRDIPADNVKFLTPETYPLQIGILDHKDGKFVEAHYHPHHKYNVVNTQEFLYVEKGTMDLVIYNADWEEKTKATLTQGDYALFVDCGHSVNFHPNTRVIEIKQGPYPGDDKAKIFKNQKS